MRPGQEDKRVSIRILLVEDDKSVASLYVRLLERQDIRAVDVANSEGSAIALASDREYDWVLLDEDLKPGGLGARVFPHLRVPLHRVIGISTGDGQSYLQIRYSKLLKMNDAIDHIISYHTPLQTR